ncbi:MAG: putative iron transport regulator transrane protein [Rariglobus sp.]|jgi:transmembrane sensor|nr:putative iron transport regulator transrane protein [Rariglobus sp.]
MHVPPPNPAGPDDETPDATALRLLARRLDPPRWTAHDEAELQQWLAASPAHAEAFHRAGQTLAALDNRTVFPEGEIDRVLAARPARKSSRRTLAAWALPALAAAALVLMAVLLWPVHWQQEFTTQIAERREVTLPDGSRVSLDARTTLTCDFTRDARRVQLLGGRATFQVTPDSHRPFTVSAGDRVVRVVGTFFEVAWRPAAGLPAPVHVAVNEGIVELRTRRPDGRDLFALRLTARQQTRWFPDSALPQVATLPADAFAAWREGQLRYRNARLDDVLADLAAYFPGRIDLTDPALANLRVTGTLRADAPQDALATLADILPLRLEQPAPGHLVIIPAAPAPVP